MVFSSPVFLFIFLPLVSLFYYLTPLRFRNLILLLSSFIFYAWGAPKIVLLLVFSCGIDYYLGRAIFGKKSLYKLWISILLNLSFLFYYKYANFFIYEFNSILSFFGLEGLSWTNILLPIGISFFTFQKISYLVDLYRGIAQPASNFLNYCLFVSLFPQLIAGPIVRYHEISKQIEKRKYSIEKFFLGSARFSIGLAKKILIADQMGAIADNIFGMRSSLLAPEYIWLGVLAYSFQIYFDFSGYSDMAIGLGKIFGFNIPENFNFPYLAKNFTDFWRRWHLSLSRWMKDYLYIPLGGNRKPRLRTYLNLWIVFLLSGVWHGASWNFIFWGAFHGLFLSIDKLFWQKISKKIPEFINIAFTFFLVLISWIFFRADNLTEAVKFLSIMFDFSNWSEYPRKIFPLDLIHNRGCFILLLAFIFSFTTLGKRIQEYLLKDNLKNRFIYGGVILLLLFLSILSISTADYSPFLYFRF